MIIGDRFKVKKMIGAGNFGKIYEVQSIESGEVYALKSEEKKRYVTVKHEYNILKKIKQKVNKFESTVFHSWKVFFNVKLFYEILKKCLLENLKLGCAYLVAIKKIEPYFYQLLPKY